MFPLPLVVSVGASRSLRHGLIALHLLAGCALAVSALPLAWRLAGMLVLCLSAWRRTRPRPPVELRCDREGKLARATAQGWREQRLGQPLVVLPGLCLITLRPAAGGPAHGLLIPADSLDAQAFRRLRVWLRWRAANLKRPG